MTEKQPTHTNREIAKIKLQIAILILIIMAAIPLGSVVEAQDIPAEVDLQCVYRIEGIINEQTLLDLELNESSISESMWDETAAICLDSPGGTLLSANKWQDLSISTFGERRSLARQAAHQRVRLHLWEGLALLGCTHIVTVSSILAVS